MSQTRTSTPDHPRRTGFDSSPRLAPLLDELLWPKLFRGWALALRPASLGIGLVMLVLIALIGGIPEFFRDAPPPGVYSQPFIEQFVDRTTRKIGELKTAIFDFNVTGITESIWGLVISNPLVVLKNHPWPVTLLGPIILLVWVVGGGAIARMAACDFSAGYLVSWPQALRQSTSRWGSLVMAIAGPMLLVAAIGLLISILSWVGFSIPYVKVVAGALYVMVILFSLLAVVVLVGYALGASMLVPAVVSEGTDGIDAIQRAYAYAYGNPLRVVLYGLILVVQGLIAYAVLAFIASQVSKFGVGAATVFLGPENEAIVRGTSVNGDPLTGAAATASRLVQFWNKVPALLVSAYVVSYIFSAPAVMYLLLRQVNDGQDIGELWMPGATEGAIADTVRARTEVAKAAGAGRSQPAPETGEDSGDA